MSRAATDLGAARRQVPEAVRHTAGRCDGATLARLVGDSRRLVISASGNSAYPARYLTWLLNTTTTIEARLMTPLEYVLAPPAHAHGCLLVSQGARRRDSYSVMTAAERRGAPFFVLCGESALEGRTVATEQPSGHVFATATLGEHAFLNIVGTAAAFAGAWEIAATLRGEPGRRFPQPDWATLDEAAVPVLESPGSVLALHGPAARCAADAFAGYHSESMGPARACDMKNFTHGVWRGLDESGRASVYLVTERAVEPLARFVYERLAAGHACALVRAPREIAPSVEPFALFIIMLDVWIRRAVRHAEARGDDWSPLAIDGAHYAPLLELTRFDLDRLAAPESDAGE